MKKTFGFLVCIFLSLPVFCYAQKGDVVINEIDWMGTKISANNEWIELYNTTNNDIDLFGWKLLSSNGTIKANLKGFIVAKGYYLMERTDDNSVPEVPADVIYTGNLSNAGEDLTLHDTQKNIVDQVNFLTWPTGNNTTKQTMEKTLGRSLTGEAATGWQTSLNPGGTPKAENSSGIITVTAPAVATAGASTIALSYPTGVVINEILPQPQTTESLNEWIELYNTNVFTVDLGGWKLQDTAGAIKTYTFPKGTSIAGNGYLVAKRPDTDITLGNTADGVNLLWPNKKVVNSVSYAKAIKNQSYNKTDSDWQWSKSLTPGTVNAPNTVLPNDQKTDNTYLSALSQPLKPQSSNPWLLFLTALGLTIACAVIVVIVKIKLFNKHTN